MQNEMWRIKYEVKLNRDLGGTRPSEAWETLKKIVGIILLTAVKGRNNK